MAIKIYSEEIREFIRKNSLGNNADVLTKMINDKFGTSFEASKINTLRYGLGCKSGIDTKIKKGNSIGSEYWFQKGSTIGMEFRIKKGERRGIATEFKKGQRPLNWVPVGTERVREPDRYIWIKIKEPNKWMEKHRWVWIQNHGPIPKRKNIMFLDGNRLNCSIENLAMVDDSQMLILNNKKLVTPDPELTKASITLSSVYLSISKRAKEVTSNV